MAVAALFHPLLAQPFMLVDLCSGAVVARRGVVQALMLLVDRPFMRGAAVVPLVLAAELAALVAQPSS